MESIIKSQNDTIYNLSDVLDSIYDRIPSSVSTDYLAEKLDAIRNAIDDNSSYLNDIAINTGG